MKSIAMINVGQKSLPVLESRTPDEIDRQRLMNWMFISDGEYLKTENGKMQIVGTPVRPGSNTHRFRAMVHLRKKYFS